MKQYFIMAAGLFAFAAIPTFAANFTQCPPTGSDTNGCELLITVSAVNASGAATAFSVATASPDQGPFDGVEDTLIGIVNSAPATLNTIALSGIAGGDGIFDFDGDGACPAGSYSPSPTAAQCGSSTQNPTGYGSAGVSFTGIGGTLDSVGTVVLTGGLATGASTWFDLEGPVTATIISGGGGVPEPASLVLIGTGLSALYFMRRRKA